MKNPTLNVVVAVATVGALGAVALTMWVGAKVREDTVVAKPYEEGLRQAADREARERLRWDVKVEGGAVAAGAGTITFAVLDGAGKPLDGAEVEVALSRPDTSRDVKRARAVAIGPGRWAADTGVSGRGEWLVAFDVSKGADRLRIEKAVRSADACDLGAGPCTLPAGDAELTLELGPRPLRTMASLAAVASLAAGGKPVPGAAVRVSLAMPGMQMGENVVVLKEDAPGRYVGTATVVRCMSGRKDWEATVEVTLPGQAAGPEAKRTARFPFKVVE
ncbi:MAG: FixH family protein [Anaeromyxobacter sp.]